MDFKQKILCEFESGNWDGKTEKQLCRLFSRSVNEQKILMKTIDGLCAEGLLVHDEKYRYHTPEKAGAILGIVSVNRNGSAFLLPKDRKKFPCDFYIHRNGLNGAYHGDTVLCIPHFTARSADEVKVIRVLERGFAEIVGTFRRGKGYACVSPSEQKLAFDVVIPKGKCLNARDGEKVVVKILQFPKYDSPIGEVVEVLGDGSDFAVEELALIRAHGLKEIFPEEVLRSARSTPEWVPEEKKQGRLDLRNELIVTVDGEDTRDIDDAISVQKTGKNYKLGVHIADVSEYVPFNGVLDREALRRGTSVYFPDSVLPMLPRELSNGICSLNEGVDRLTLSCLMIVDRAGNVLERKIVRSVIRSAHRLTYHAVEDIANGKKEALAAYPDLKEFVADAFALTKILQEKRRRRGEVELSVKEAKIERTDDGKIVIPDYEYLASQEMIEQFMVLANEQVAEQMTEEKVPFVYRVHEKPNSEKAEELKNFLLSLGISVPFQSENALPQDYRKILLRVRNTPTEGVVNRVMLRSMAKARYDCVNIGHFGLASECYCHFTSPIRRYPDLCIHRIIKGVIDGNKQDVCLRYAKFVSEASVNSSACEKKAVEAEREVDDLYKTAYCAQHIGEEFTGVISGVIASGFFVELANTVEGFVSVRDFSERFDFLEDRLLLRSGKRSFRIGDGVKVKIAGVDFGNRRTDFLFLEKLSEIV